MAEINDEDREALEGLGDEDDDDETGGGTPPLDGKTQKDKILEAKELVDEQSEKLEKLLGMFKITLKQAESADELKKLAAAQKDSLDGARLALNAELGKAEAERKLPLLRDRIKEIVKNIEAALAPKTGSTPPPKASPRTKPADPAAEAARVQAAAEAAKTAARDEHRRLETLSRTERADLARFDRALGLAQAILTIANYRAWSDRSRADTKATVNEAILSSLLTDEQRSLYVVQANKLGKWDRVLGQERRLGEFLALHGLTLEECESASALKRHDRFEIETALATIESEVDKPESEKDFPELSDRMQKIHVCLVEALAVLKERERLSDAADRSGERIPPSRNGRNRQPLPRPFILTPPDEPPPPDDEPPAPPPRRPIFTPLPPPPEDEHAADDEPPPPPPRNPRNPANPPRRSSNWGKIFLGLALLAIVAAAGGYALWHHFGGGASHQPVIAHHPTTPGPERVLRTEGIYDVLREDGTTLHVRTTVDGQTIRLTCQHVADAGLTNVDTQHFVGTETGVNFAPTAPYMVLPGSEAFITCRNTTAPLPEQSGAYDITGCYRCTVEQASLASR